MKLESTKILVTGADGFIGSHLCERLLESGARVRALALYNSFNDWGWLECIPENEGLEVVTGDIRDPHFCRSLTSEIDIIFNLAALIAIPYSYRAPEQYLQTNAAGTLNLCQGALENNCSRFIQLSTSEVYGTARYVPIDEAHPLQAQSPYSASKIAADAMAYSYFSTFHLPVVIARPFNTYGPRQSARAVIPTIITQIAGGMREIKLGNTRPTRDFNYVADTCEGLIALSSADEAIGESVNIGSGREISIGDVALKIAELMGVQITVQCEEQRLRPENSEVERLVCDSSKLRKLSGMEPSCTLEEGLKQTIRWFSDPGNLTRYKIDQYNV